MKSAAVMVVLLVLACGVAYLVVRHFRSRTRVRQVPDSDQIFGTPLSEAADAFLTESNVEFNRKQAEFHSKWLTGYDRYDIDAQGGKLTLTRGDTRIHFDVQALGSVSKGDSTWQWSWHNPNVPEQASRASAELKAVGAKYGLPYLQKGIVPLPNEQFPWYLGGIALKVTNLEGIFVAHAGEMEYYFLLAHPISQQSDQPAN